MPRRIQTPDGVIQEFPDEATDAQIAEALASYKPAADPTMNFAIVNGKRVPLGADEADVIPRTGAQILQNTGGAQDLRNLAGGIRAGLATSVFGGGDLIRRGYNAVAPESMQVERVINRPEVQAGMTAPPGVAGMIGKGAEQVAEFAVPSGMVSGAVAKAPFLARAAAQAALGGGVSAAQGNSPVIGAVAGAGGEGLASAAKTAAPWLMNRALNATDRLAREFPNMTDTMLENALTVSKGSLEKARTMLTAAKATANAALAKADAAGLTVPVTAATDGLMQTLTKVANSKDIEGGLKILAGIERRIGVGRAAELTPAAADALKTSLQTESKALYRMIGAGQGRPAVTVAAQALADMAQNLNQQIGAITEKAGAVGAESYVPANLVAQEMMGAARGIQKGTRPASTLYQAMVRPAVGAVMGGLTGRESGYGTKGALVGTVLGAAATSPIGMSNLAVALAKPSVQAILRTSPRLAAAVASLMTQGNQPPAAAAAPGDIELPAEPR